jgi:hypothetical protein
MKTYTPDRWVILEISTLTSRYYKVFAGWYGGFLGSDSWKLNSGIVSVTPSDDFYDFCGYTSSIYHCYMHDYGFTGLMLNVLEGWERDLAQKPGMSIRVLKFEEIPLEYEYLE